MLTILGGGPAGLAAADEAARRGYPCQLFEASPRLGGNCTTFEWQGFRYDSGAHRLHDKDPEVTARIKSLLGDELERVEAPSQICTPHGFVTFPLQAARLPFQLGLRQTLSAAWHYLCRPRHREPPDSFEALALQAYGRTLADLFLLGYSEKLWGAPCARLAPEISGRRLRGLNLAALLPRSGRTPAHMEGAFYYPRGGYGRICDRLADAAGRERLHTRSAVTGLIHDSRRIRQIEINRDTLVEAHTVCSTLPLDLMLRLMRPAPPTSLVEAAGTLRFRSLVLVALFLDLPSVSPNASLYFPDPSVPFTRVVEPRNRSAAMSPPGRTSLVAEIPCFADDGTWQTSDAELAARVARDLAAIGLMRPEHQAGFEVRRLSHAYPILEVGIQAQVERLLEYFEGFDNLVVTGRNGRFTYRHLHDMVRSGMDTIAALEAAGRLRGRTPAAPARPGGPERSAAPF